MNNKNICCGLWYNSKKKWLEFKKVFRTFFIKVFKFNHLKIFYLKTYRKCFNIKYKLGYLE